MTNENQQENKTKEENLAKEVSKATGIRTEADPDGKSGIEITQHKEPQATQKNNESGSIPQRQTTPTQPESGSPQSSTTSPKTDGAPSPSQISKRPPLDQNQQTSGMGEQPTIPSNGQGQQQTTAETDNKNEQENPDTDKTDHPENQENNEDHTPINESEPNDQGEKPPENSPNDQHNKQKTPPEKDPSTDNSKEKDAKKTPEPSDSPKKGIRGRITEELDKVPGLRKAQHLQNQAKNAQAIASHPGQYAANLAKQKAKDEANKLAHKGVEVGGKLTQKATEAGLNTILPGAGVALNTATKVPIVGKAIKYGFQGIFIILFGLMFVGIIVLPILIGNALNPANKIIEIQEKLNIHIINTVDPTLQALLQNDQDFRIQIADAGSRLQAEGKIDTNNSFLPSAYAASDIAYSKEVLQETLLENWEHIPASRTDTSFKWLEGLKKTLLDFFSEAKTDEERREILAQINEVEKTQDALIQKAYAEMSSEAENIDSFTSYSAGESETANSIATGNFTPDSEYPYLSSDIADKIRAPKIALFSNTEEYNNLAKFSGASAWLDIFKSGHLPEENIKDVNNVLDPTDTITALNLLSNTAFAEGSSELSDIQSGADITLREMISDPEQLGSIPNQEFFLKNILNSSCSGSIPDGLFFELWCTGKDNLGEVFSTPGPTAPEIENKQYGFSGQCNYAGINQELKEAVETASRVTGVDCALILATIQIETRGTADPQEVSENNYSNCKIGPCGEYGYTQITHCYDTNTQSPGLTYTLKNGSNISFDNGGPGTIIENGRCPADSGNIWGRNCQERGFIDSPYEIWNTREPEIKKLLNLSSDPNPCELEPNITGSALIIKDNVVACDPSGEIDTTEEAMCVYEKYRGGCEVSGTNVCETYASYYEDFHIESEGTIEGGVDAIVTEAQSHIGLSPTAYGGNTLDSKLCYSPSDGYNCSVGNLPVSKYEWCILHANSVLKQATGYAISNFLLPPNDRELRDSFTWHSFTHREDLKPGDVMYLRGNTNHASVLIGGSYIKGTGIFTIQTVDAGFGEYVISKNWTLEPDGTVGDFQLIGYYRYE